MKPAYLSIAFAFAVSAAALAQDQAAEPEKAERIKKTEVGSTPNMSVYQDKVYFGGQPQADDIKKFKELGVTTVINLRTKEEMDALGYDEATVVEEAGLKYVHVPMGRDEPTEEFIAEALKSLSDSADGKVLLHCGSSNRVGYVWSLFAAKQRGLTADEAVAEGKAAGMRAPQLEAWARKHIDAAKKDE